MAIEHEIDTPFALAVRRIGSQSATGRLIKRSQGAVNSRLKSRKPVWPEAVLTLEAETGISRHDLRPDIYGPKPKAAVAPVLADTIERAR